MLLTEAFDFDLEQCGHIEVQIQRETRLVRPSLESCGRALSDVSTLSRHCEPQALRLQREENKLPSLCNTSVLPAAIYTVTITYVYMKMFNDL